MRRKRNLVILLVVVVVAVLVGIYYTFKSSVVSSPVYSSRRVLYALERDGEYYFVVVFSDKKMVKILKANGDLYDPDTRKCLCEDSKEAVGFFEKVFSFSPDFSFYLDLSGENLEKFSKLVLGKARVEKLEDLIRALADRRRNPLDVFKVGSMAREMRFFSSMDGPALLKLLDSLSKYGVDEDEIKGMAKEPLKITVSGKTFERIYITSDEKKRISEELK